MQVASSPSVNAGGIGNLNPLPARGPTTRDLLKMQWDFAVYTPTEERSDGTAVKAKREALPVEDAFRSIAGTDPRPLLVLRECQVCNKTDDALLKPGADNERTILLSKWFHCVKLPVDVIVPDQPFNALFPTNDAEHLFVCAADGSSRIPLESDTSRTELWTAMTKVLAATYVRDPSSALKQIRRAHDEIDAIDRKLEDLEKKRDELAEEAGKMDKSKMKSLGKEIEALKRSLEDEKKHVDRLAKIDLKPPKKA